MGSKVASPSSRRVLPVSLFDDSGILFVAVFNTGTILKFTPDGTQTTFAVGLTNAAGLAIDRDGDLFAADLGGGTIFNSPL